MFCVVQRLLQSYKDALEAGSRMLLEKEVLFGDDVEGIVARHPPTELPPGTNGSGSDDSASSNGGPPATKLPVGATA